MMILFPLTFASNIFVDPTTMPPWLLAFVNTNPVTITVTAVRGFMHTTVTADPIYGELMMRLSRPVDLVDLDLQQRFASQLLAGSDFRRVA